MAASELLETTLHLVAHLLREIESGDPIGPPNRAMVYNGEVPFY